MLMMDSSLHGSMSRIPTGASPIATGKQLVVAVECRSESPLVMNRFNPDAGPVSPLIAERCRAKMYLDTDGRPMIPGVHLLAALREAGRKVMVNGEQISTSHRTHLYSVVDIATQVSNTEGERGLRLWVPDGLDAACPLPSSGGDPVNDPKSAWRVETHRLGRFGNLHLSRFDVWGFSCEVTIDLDAMEGLTQDHVKQLFARAGNRIGLMHWRAEYNGLMGRFEIADWRAVFS